MQYADKDQLAPFTTSLKTQQVTQLQLLVNDVTPQLTETDKGSSVAVLLFTVTHLVIDFRITW